MIQSLTGINIKIELNLAQTTGVVLKRKRMYLAMNSFYSKKELVEIGFRSIGENVLISKKVSIYGASKITIKNNVRIDDFVILSGKIEIGNFIHVAAYSALFAGDEGIFLKDFSNISSRVSIYAISDDFSGLSLTNPMVSDDYKQLEKGRVMIDRHVVIGASSIVLPNVVIGEGVAIGSMSLINEPLDSWGVYIGVPARRIKERSKRLLQLEKEFLIRKDVSNLIDSY